MSAEPSLRRPASPVRARSLAPLFAFVALAVLPGCQTKREQCNAFIEKANAAEKTIEGVSDFGNAEKLESDATKIDVHAKAVEGLKLDDAELVALRSKYVANLSLYAKNLRATAAAKGDGTKLEALEKEDAQIQHDGSKLIDDINAHCEVSK
jgi:hypothetical protein